MWRRPMVSRCQMCLTSEGDMRMMLLLWDATSLKIVEIPIKTTLNNPDFPEK